MSTFTQFLKKFALDVLHVVEGVEGAPQVVVQDLAQGMSDIKSLFDLIKQSEGIAVVLKLPTPAGDQKLAMIRPDVLAIISDVEIVTGTRLGSIIKDQAEFNSGVDDLIGALVKITNACGH